MSLSIVNVNMVHRRIREGCRKMPSRSNAANYQGHDKTAACSTALRPPLIPKANLGWDQ